MRLCSTNFKITKKGKWYYAKYRRWWMPFYVTIDYWSDIRLCKLDIDSFKSDGVVYRECV